MTYNSCVEKSLKGVDTPGSPSFLRDQMVEADNMSEHAPSEELGRSYERLLGEQLWEVDVPADLSALAVDSVVEAVPPPLTRIIEALLFLGGEPLTLERAALAVRGLSEGQLLQSIEELNGAYRLEGRPYTIAAHGTGWVLELRSRYRSLRAPLRGSVREAHLSPAAVDVLALIAYRQPATRSEIDSLRGSESGPVIRQLVRHGLIAIVRRGVTGQQEVAYGTTPRFLDLFGLASLDELPRMQDLQRL